MATGTAPIAVTSTTLVPNLYVARALLADTPSTNHDMTGPITGTGNVTSVTAQTGGGSVFVMQNTPSLTTPNIGAASGTSLTVTGQLTSTVATGTAPFVVSSTTTVANLSTAFLNGKTFEVPGTIGSTTPNSAVFSSLTSNSTTVLNGTTVPASKTLVVTTDKLSVHAATSSSELAGVISDETGTGSLVFGTSPTFTTSLFSPLIIGGSTTTSGLTLQATSGVGTTGSNITFLVGNNGLTEAMKIIDTGMIGIGGVTPSAWLDVRATGNSVPHIQAYNRGTQSGTGGAIIQMSSNAGAVVMASGSRLGSLVYAGASDISSTISTGASIDSVTTETWSSSANGANLVFKVTPNTTSTQAVALTLGQDKSAVFTGTVTFPTPFTLGAVSVTTTGTKLNFLSAATGTTGTTSTNLVFSTSPTLVTPNLGTPTAVILTSATGLPLTTGVTGILPIANGGTNSASAAGGFNNLNPMTTTGDLIYEVSTGVAGRIPIGSSLQVLTVISGVPTWTAPATGGTVTSVAASVPSFLSISGSPITSSGTLAITYSGTALPVANGGTGTTTSTGTGSTVLSAGPTFTGSPSLSNSGDAHFQITSTGAALAFTGYTSGSTSGVVGIQTTSGLFGGASANAMIVGNQANAPLQLGVNNVVSMTISSPSGAVAITGSNTNDSAASGYVGEYISSFRSSGSPVTLVTNTAKTVTSISLTPGDWEISTAAGFSGSGTVTNYQLSCITTTDNSASGSVIGDTQGNTIFSSFAVTDAFISIPGVRVSITTTTIYYLIAQIGFTSGTANAYGRISARRMR